MVPHVSPSSWTRLKRGYDSPTFFTGQALENPSRRNSQDMTHANVQNGQQQNMVN